VWPSTKGIFAWQPGGSAAVEAAQPASWRFPQTRQGALAADPPWPYPAAPDDLAVACDHVVDEGAPPNVVQRVEDTGEEQWQFLCSSDNHDLEQLRAYHFAHLARRMPSLLDLQDLGRGQRAVRETCWSPWVRERPAA
jgi:hypothetical protein